MSTSTLTQLLTRVAVLPVPNSPCGLCRRKATLNSNIHQRVQELCESRGGRPGLPVPNSPHGLCGRKATLKKKKKKTSVVFIAASIPVAPCLPQNSEHIKPVNGF